jgi:hypothetical protein
MKGGTLLKYFEENEKSTLFVFNNINIKDLYLLFKITFTLLSKNDSQLKI